MITHEVNTVCTQTETLVFISVNGAHDRVHGGTDEKQRDEALMTCMSACVWYTEKDMHIAVK